MDHLTRARAICLALPETTEQIAWGAPTFRVRDKMFATFADDHHGDGRMALWVKAAPGEQEVLVRSEPEKFFVPPYLGVKGWVGVDLDHTSDERVARHVREAYRLIAPKRLQTLLDD